MKHIDKSKQQFAGFKAHETLVVRIAKMFKRNLPANIELDDLIQVGNIGLLEALTRYEAIEGCAFESYASTRIRGSILDYLRRVDCLTRQNRKDGMNVEFVTVEDQDHLEQLITDPEDESSNPLRLLLDKESSSRVKVALERLSNREREVIEESFFSSQPDMQRLAKDQAVSVSYIQAIRKRALGKLSELLEP